MTINNTNSLEKLGLTINEITIYTYLLRKGVSSGKEIYQDTELDKSSAYEALANLQNKQLIYVIGQTRNQKFGPVSPEKLEELIHHKQQELDQVKTDVNTFISSIDEIAKQSYKNKNIRIFDGDQGFLNWSRARLEGPNNTLIRTLGSYNLHAQYIKNYDTEYSQEQVKLRLAKGIPIKALVKKEDLKTRNTSLNKTDPKLLKEVRLLPDDFELVASLATFGHNTSFLRRKENQFFGLVIDDKLITALVNSLFDQIWANCKSV